VLTPSLAPVLTSPIQSWSARRPSPDGYIKTLRAFAEDKPQEVERAAVCVIDELGRIIEEIQAAFDK
jgi:hypothetical protein